ncbi:hypothetical protein SCUCBS95973_002026, partial [Sporothrix curviconia]
LAIAPKPPPAAETYADEAAPVAVVVDGHVEVHTSETEEKTRGVEHDDAADLFVGESTVFEYTEEEAKRVLWKLDLFCCRWCYLSFIDKAVLSNASILGLLDDDHLVGQDYSWASAIFYFGYLIFQYPSSLCMQNFATLAVCRFFLGAFETCITPVMAIYVGQYWTRREQPLRACIWWMGAPLGGFTANGRAYSITSAAWGGGKYSQWQVLFLIWGPITIAWGVVLLFALPNSPMKAWFLDQRERKVAVMRVIANHTGIENRDYRRYQVFEALKDIQCWVYFCLVLLQCIVGSGLLVSAYLANRFRNARIFVSLVSNVVALTGSLLAYCLPASDPHGRQGGICIMCACTVTYIMAMSMMSANMGCFTKKATCSAMFFLSREAPTYPTGFRAFFVSTALMIVIQFSLLFYIFRENKRRNAISAGLSREEQADAAAFLDMTDKEQPGFRYVY